MLASRLDHAGSTIERAAAVDLIGLAAEEAVRVDASFDVVTIGANPVEIQGDAALLRRLVRNLLENASKHGRPPVCISLERHEEAVRIVVSDRGPGIAPSERERVFEPFYRPAGHGGLPAADGASDFRWSVRSPRGTEAAFFATRRPAAAPASSLI